MEIKPSSRENEFVLLSDKGNPMIKGSKEEMERIMNKALENRIKNVTVFSTADIKPNPAQWWARN